ncbi:hypothetical protein NX059_006419 [Plenodomus lindquistii]|nr:hypothetical protein NX059_006419 [Plenodomus lindquistii]
MFRSKTTLDATTRDQRIPNIIEEDEDGNIRTSIDSTSSAAERLQWRNHAAVLTPSAQLEERDPFSDLTFSKTEQDSQNAQDHPYENDRPQEAHHINTTSHPSTSDEESTINDDTNSTHPPTTTTTRRKTLSFKQRIRHFTWTWFTLTMATGGIANVLYTLPHPYRFPSLYALGCTFFLLNIVLFLFNVVMISCRFYFYPRTFRASFLHPTESLFIPGATVSFGIICLNVSQYGVGVAGVGGWLERVMVGLFWADCGLAVMASLGVYLVMWSTTTFTINQMTPIWIFPAYPLLIIGPHAGSLAPKVTNPNTALSIILGGFVIQGIGFLVSLMIYAAFIYRLMTQKLPKESLRPGMFISVGPSGFTIAALINMGQELPRIVPPDFMGPGNGELAGKVGMIMGNFTGLWLWGLALWFFFVSVGAHWSCAARGKMDFAMTWYSFIFPNTALTTATFAVAKALDGNRPIAVVGCVMTVGLVLMWFFVVGMNVRAVVVGQILWPEKQEDRTEGGWTQQSAEDQGRKGGEGGEGTGVVAGVRDRTKTLVRTLSRKGTGIGVRDGRREGVFV